MSFAIRKDDRRNGVSVTQVTQLPSINTSFQIAYTHKGLYFDTFTRNIVYSGPNYRAWQFVLTQ